MRNLAPASKQGFGHFEHCRATGEAIWGDSDLGFNAAKNLGERLTTDFVPNLSIVSFEGESD